MINIIGKNIIKATLSDGVKKAKIHSISADEVTFSNDEILSICMGYLDEFQNICEVLIGFLNPEGITLEHLGEAILKFFSEFCLDVKECKGQCSDGAANIQSIKKRCC